ncbi:MAG: hypothetical protein IT371_18740 [Deltaproteobacteria bacterium]|nr:hypothetical protein [Deltaproteobacteria bacterium]
MLALLVATLCPARPSRAHPPQGLSPQQLAQLARWEVLASSEQVSGAGVMQGKALGLFQEVPEALVHTILDIGRYKFYLPRMKSSRVVKVQGPHTFAVLETDFPWPVRDAWVYIKMTYTRTGARSYRLRWWMENGTLKQYTGEAEIVPFDAQATRTLLTYKLLAQPKTAAPDGVISKGVRRVAEVFVQRLRLRIQALRKYNKLPAGLLSLYR